MDTVFLHTLLDFIAQHPLLTGLIVCFVAFAESLAIVGLFMPGAMLMFGFGMLIGSGQLAFIDAYLWSVAGAVAGDGLSYWLGRHYHQRLKVVWPFRRYPVLIAKGTDFFTRHGSMSILFGRFVGPVRPIVPAIAGMMEMSPRRFLLVNLISALLWAPAYLLPGMAFGASLSLAAEVAGRLVVLLLLVLVLLVVTIWLIRHLVSFLQPRSNPLIYAVLHRTRQVPYLGGITEALLDPQHPETRVLGGLFLLLPLTSAGLAILLQHTLFTGTEVGPMPQAIHHLLQTLRIGWADQLMEWFSQFGSLYFLLPCVGLMAAALLLRRDLATPVYLGLLLLLAQLSVLLLKNVTLVERPIELYQGLHQYAFPSSHTLMATVVYGFLAVVLAARLPMAWRWLPYTGAAVLSLLVGFSRLYLGLHWFTDILGGVLLGLLWVALAGIAYRRHHRCALHARSLLGLMLLATLLGMLVHGLLAPAPPRPPATPPVSPTTLTQGQWLQGQWQALPALRQDLRGFNDQPFNLQWAGSEEELGTRLQQAGWHAPTRLSLTTALRYLAPAGPIDELPIPTHMHADQGQTLLFTRPRDASQLLVLRLWPSSYRLAGGRPIWFGNVTTMQVETRWRWLQWVHTLGDYDKALAQLGSEPLGAGCQPRQRAQGTRLLLCY